MTDSGELHAALVRGRVAVEQRWSAGIDQEHEPGEEVLTDLLLQAAEPEVSHAWFNQRQEGEVGADWLWWFVDGLGEAFGLLVQAKKLVRHANTWTTGIDYESGGELQIAKLLRSSDALKVPAAYVLYTGDTAYREGLTCASGHVDDCDRCARSGTTILSALEAEAYVRTWGSGRDLYQTARPLEDLALPNPSQVRDLNMVSVQADLKAFLLKPQLGSRSVAKEVFRYLSRLRSEQLSAASPAVDSISVPILSNLPADRGHMSRPYFRHVLQGLRTNLPPTVVALFAGDPAAERQFDGLAGVALLRA